MASLYPSYKQPMESYCGRQTSAFGFSYIGLLILIAVLSMAAAATVQMGAVIGRHDAEESLLDIGHAYRAAIASYYHATPEGEKAYPPDLLALLRDRRFATVRRHLRSLYPDPVTGKSEWGIVRAPNGGVMGVYSLSSDPPIKAGNFQAEDQGFETARTLRDWLFVYEEVASK